jgi:glycosidase
MADFDRLLAEVHARGMRLVLDLVPNHSSHLHPWFIASRSARDDPRRAWYIWRDPAPGGGPPNNWLSHFGGPAWTFDEASGQYYMHQFLPQQPELNHRHPEVLPAILDCMRFWLDKGVDGFRVDVIGMLLKDPLFRDEPENPSWNGVREYQRLLHVHTANLPEVHALIRRMRAFLDGWDDRLMIGELYLPNADLVRYYGDEQGAECHLPFNFQLIRAPWDAAGVRPWLPLAPDCGAHNVARQLADPSSALAFFRAMSALRRAEPALASGSYRSLDAGQPDVFAYLRGDPGNALLVLLNFAAEPRCPVLPLSCAAADLLLSTTMTPPRRVSLSQLVLAADEGMVLRLPVAGCVA